MIGRPGWRLAGVRTPGTDRAASAATFTQPHDGRSLRRGTTALGNAARPRRGRSPGALQRTVVSGVREA